MMKRVRKPASESEPSLKRQQSQFASHPFTSRAEGPEAYWGGSRIRFSLADIDIFSRETVQPKQATGSVLQAKEEAPPNRTGMPDHLKSGLENLSGLDISSLRVHYSSPKPAQLNALAYTQGQEIHVAPGQGKHLAHEGWHAVQQMQGRVKVTGKVGEMQLNDSMTLESEADMMGSKALHSYSRVEKPKGSKSQSVANGLSQMNGSGELTFQFVDNRPKTIEQSYSREMTPSGKIVQRVIINGILVVKEGGFPCFSLGGKKYHINENDPKHVTCDTDKRTHYYFNGSGQDIVGIVGPGKKKNKLKFEDLPQMVQRFITDHYDAIVNVKDVGQINV
jgi:hypothetical protein